jgi:hypothetical protein
MQVSGLMALSMASSFPTVAAHVANNQSCKYANCSETARHRDTPAREQSIATSAQLKSLHANRTIPSGASHQAQHPGLAGSERRDGDTLVRSRQQLAAAGGAPRPTTSGKRAAGARMPSTGPAGRASPPSTVPRSTAGVVAAPSGKRRLVPSPLTRRCPW